MAVATRRGVRAIGPVAASRNPLPRPAGCAKTTMARAAATASGATTVTLAAADVFSKYVGEGERVLRDAFARARRAAPAVLLLGEIDGMVGSRGRGRVTPRTSARASCRCS